MRHIRKFNEKDRLTKNDAVIMNESIYHDLNDPDVDINKIKSSIDEGDVDVSYEQGILLQKAAKIGRVDIMKLLIKHGARLDQRRYMALRWAVEWGQLEAVKWIIDNIDASVLKSKSYKERSLLDEVIFWSRTSDKVSDNHKMTDYLESLL